MVVYVLTPDTVNSKWPLVVCTHSIGTQRRSHVVIHFRPLVLPVFDYPMGILISAMDNPLDNPGVNSLVKILCSVSEIQLGVEVYPVRLVYIQANPKANPKDSTCV